MKSLDLYESSEITLTARCQSAEFQVDSVRFRVWKSASQSSQNVNWIVLATDCRL